MFRHYRDILREPNVNKCLANSTRMTHLEDLREGVISTLPNYTSISNAAVGNTIYD